MEDQVHDDFYNLSYQAFDLPKSKFLSESFIFWVCLLGLIIVSDFGFRCLRSTFSKDGRYPKFYKSLDYLCGQFRYNIYIRYVMTAYLDMVFIAGLVLNSEETLSLKSLVALLVLALAFCLPWGVLIYLSFKFDKL